MRAITVQALLGYKCNIQMGKQVCAFVFLYYIVYMHVYILAPSFAHNIFLNRYSTCAIFSQPLIWTTVDHFISVYELFKDLIIKSVD